ncbi:hypothetical protein lerEdw1_016530 [Lerista edwardsae]|nr:hypothetical protein lerEdw1_016530 [Lerista edwardsae]
MPVNMKKQKLSKPTNVAHRRLPQSVALATKPSSGIHRVAETPDIQKYKSVRFGGHLCKSELVGLIEKTLQETDSLGTEEETWWEDEAWMGVELEVREHKALDCPAILRCTRPLLHHLAQARLPYQAAQCDEESETEATIAKFAPYLK